MNDLGEKKMHYFADLNFLNLFLTFFAKSFAYIKINTNFASLSERKALTVGSLAQLVEHIPFKDGVLGSNPKRVTLPEKSKRTKFLN